MNKDNGLLGCNSKVCVAKNECYRAYKYREVERLIDLIPYPKGTKKMPCEMFMSIEDVLGEDNEQVG